MTPEQLREFVPESWLGITEPLSAEQQKDLETYYRYMRHTIEIDIPRRRIYRDNETAFNFDVPIWRGLADPVFQRHTVEIDRQPMSVEDGAPQLRFSGFSVLWALVMGLAVGCIVGCWWLAHAFGSCHGG